MAVHSATKSRQHPDVASPLPYDLPANLLERTNQSERRRRPVAARSRRNWKLSPDDACADTSAFLAKSFDVQRERFLGVCRGFLERVALGVQPGKVRCVDVVAALFLRLEDKLDLRRLLHASKSTYLDRVENRPPP